VLRAVLRLRLQRPLEIEGQEVRRDQDRWHAVLTVNDITEHRVAQLQRVSRMLFAAGESERNRVAAELHDGVCQTLATLKYRLECLYNTPSVPGRELAAFAELLRQVIDEIRRVATNLAPLTIEGGVVVALENLCIDFRSTHPDVRVSTKLHAEEEQIPANLKVALHRITQEALHNVGAHASAHAVEVSVVRNEQGLELCIRDDGVGFEPQSVHRHTGRPRLGLSNMRARAAWTRGVFEVESLKGKGTVISARWRAEDIDELPGRDCL
jgi:two-component system NarL family sensor kinase